MRTSVAGLLIAGLAFVGYGALAAGPSAPPSDPSWTTVAKRVERSLVRLTNGEPGEKEKVCTAFVINSTHKLLMTALHCEPSVVWADSLKPTVLAKNQNLDLMVLQVPTLSVRPALQLATNEPELLESVAATGFAYGWVKPSIRGMHVSGRWVTDPSAGGPYLNTDAALIGGMSGGPIVNGRGQVVGVGVKTSFTDAFAVPADSVAQAFGDLWSWK